MQRPELLSPAGDYDCFLAAISSGADAVYLGGDFSARAYAKNFTPQEIVTAIDHAHLYGRKVYMTLNIVMKDAEMDTVIDYLIPFYEAGLDGVIIHDIGLFHLLKEHFPLLPLHASTQMTITDLEGVKLLDSCGAKRVVLARELSLAEIKKIHQQIDTELECFIHGSLCYAYSGKCLFSSMLGERSGNRGRCAQPCRLPYDDAYLLSLKDICTIRILPDLIRAGITSFKIEGRMKSPDYVAGVTGIYRKYIDRFLENPQIPYTIDEADEKLLLTLYTRSSHSRGYYEQRNGREMVTIDQPGYAKADETVSREAYRRFTQGFEKLSLSMKAYLHAGEAACLEASANGITVTVFGDVVDSARNRSLTEDEVRKQLSKIGGTEFSLGDLTVDLPGSVFYAVSKLNALRREAIEKLTDTFLDTYKRKYEHTDIKEIPEKSKQNEYTPKPPLLHACVETLSQLKAALTSEETDLLSLPIDLYVSNEALISELISKRNAHFSGLIVAMPYICRNGYFEKNDALISRILQNPYLKGFLIRNYESLYYLQEKKTFLDIYSDLHLYALNQKAVQFLHSFGVTHTTTPVELQKKELQFRAVFDEDLIVYGRLPLMVSAQCIQKTKGNCKKTSGFCEITDRYRVNFPVQNSCEQCVNVVYNSVPLSLHAETELIKELHPHSIRLQFSVEDAKETKERIRDFAALVSSDAALVPSFAFTKGHIRRGVL